MDLLSSKYEKWNTYVYICVYIFLNIIFLSFHDYNLYTRALASLVYKQGDNYTSFFNVCFSWK